jgi:hypothetical protein
MGTHKAYISEESQVLNKNNQRKCGEWKSSEAKRVKLAAKKNPGHAEPVKVSTSSPQIEMTQYGL